MPRRPLDKAEMHLLNFACQHVDTERLCALGVGQLWFLIVGMVSLLLNVSHLFVTQFQANTPWSFCPCAEKLQENVQRLPVEGLADGFRGRPPCREQIDESSFGMRLRHLLMRRKATRRPWQSLQTFAFLGAESNVATTEPKQRHGLLKLSGAAGLQAFVFHKTWTFTSSHTNELVVPSHKTHMLHT